MIYEVIWTVQAKTTYLKSIQYLTENWTNKEIKNFQDRVEEAIESIRSNPELYPSSKKGLAFRCVVNKQISLFYDVIDNRVELLIFWGNRQNPKRLKY